MSNVLSISSSPAVGIVKEPAHERDRLRDAVQKLEASFLQEMMKALRATVPQNSDSPGSAQADDMFSDLMDQRVSEDLAGRMHRGLGEAIYRQLARAAGWSDGEGPAFPPRGEGQ